MKKLTLAGITSILAIVALSGCMSVPKETPTAPTTTDNTTPVVEETPATNETASDNFTETYTEGEDLFYGCNEDVKALNEKINAKEIKMYKAFTSDSMNITLYKTANPDKLTKEEVDAIVSPCAELGANQVLEATDEYIVVGYPYCTGGVAPDPELQPKLYADWKDCMAIQDELQELYEL